MLIECGHTIFGKQNHQSVKLSVLSNNQIDMGKSIRRIDNITIPLNPYHFNRDKNVWLLALAAKQPAIASPTVCISILKLRCGYFSATTGASQSRHFVTLAFFISTCRYARSSFVSFAFSLASATHCSTVS